jgi:hypothetical protein
VPSDISSITNDINNIIENEVGGASKKKKKAHRMVHISQNDLGGGTSSSGMAPKS